MNDLKFAFRQFLKSPGFTIVALLTLALGIGVNTAMFGVLQALVSRSMPYREPENLVQVFQIARSSAIEPRHSVANFLDYQQSSTFEYLAALNDKPFNLAEPGQVAERIRGLQVSFDFFPLLGVRPALGRWFTPEEDQPGRNNVVVIEHGFWQRRFAGDPNIIGRVIRLDGEAVTVVGVMPESFHDIALMGPAYLWRPIAFTAEQRSNRGNQFLKCIGRLKAGVSVKQARGAGNLLAATQLKDHPDNSPQGLRLVPLAEASLSSQGRIVLWSILSLTGFVLLIACVNLANLQFARTAARCREFAVRGALGAPPSRLIRQLLVESLLISSLGGLLGIVVAYGSNVLLKRQFAVEGEPLLNLELNLKVLSFAVMASFFSGTAFGLAPAWLASRMDVNTALKQGTRGSTQDRAQHRMQNALIVAEMALALILLAGAGWVMSGLRSFAQRDPGWKVDGLTVGYLTLPESKYKNENAIREFTSRLEEKVAAIPGVEHVSVAWSLPVGQFNQRGDFQIDARPQPPKGVSEECFINGVTPGYFETLGMRLQTGRAFSEADTTNRPPVMIINEAMAHAYWPGSSPVGQKINGREIVGVVGNVRFPGNTFEQPTPYQTYRPFLQSPGLTFAIAIRGRITAEILRRTVAEVDPDQPVGKPGPLNAIVAGNLEALVLGGRVLTLFASLGLALAALGIYGVMSGFVVHRTIEIGIRLALGAQIRDVIWLVLKIGLRLSLIGTAIGLAGAFAFARVLASVMSEFQVNNPILIGRVAVVLVFVALLACWIPARRATRVDPMVALRN